MDNNNKVYAISEGEYSDWSIIGVFSTREKAEQARDDLKTIDETWSGVNDEVIEYTLDKHEPFMGRKPFEVILDWGSGNGEANELDSLYHMDDMNTSRKEDTGKWHHSNVKPWMASGEVFITYCMADDKKHALKIASERMAQSKATNLL